MQKIILILFIVFCVFGINVRCDRSESGDNIWADGHIFSSFDSSFVESVKVTMTNFNGIGDFNNSISDKIEYSDSAGWYEINQMVAIEEKRGCGGWTPVEKMYSLDIIYSKEGYKDTTVLINLNDGGYNPHINIYLGNK